VLLAVLGCNIIRNKPTDKLFKIKIMNPYLRLIRWPNLMIIVLFMVLVRYYLIAIPLGYAGVDLPQSAFHFALLILVMVLLSAAGYIINDYFDMDVDGFNKADHQIAGKIIPADSVRRFYWIINLTALLIGFYLSLALESLQLALIFVMISGMLWFYSARYKRMLLLGNVVIALGAALGVVIVWFFELKGLIAQPNDFAEAMRAMPFMAAMVFAYALFAMISTFIRELVKDLEDMKGDERCGCRTLPVVYGSTASRNLALAVSIILIALIAFWQYVLFQRQVMGPFWALFGADLLGILVILRLYAAEERKHYRQASVLLKVLMLLGILSIPFIYL
jgi:4-hydroxybenzoate polyprenyltransferase